MQPIQPSPETEVLHTGLPLPERGLRWFEYGTMGSLWPTISDRLATILERRG